VDGGSEIVAGELAWREICDAVLERRNTGDLNRATPNLFE
jgi:hypothetical protein